MSNPHKQLSQILNKWIDNFDKDIQLENAFEADVIKVHQLCRRVCQQSQHSLTLLDGSNGGSAPPNPTIDAGVKEDGDIVPSTSTGANVSSPSSLSDSVTESPVHVSSHVLYCSPRGTTGWHVEKYYLVPDLVFFPESAVSEKFLAVTSPMESSKPLENTLAPISRRLDDWTDAATKQCVDKNTQMFILPVVWYEEITEPPGFYQVLYRTNSSELYAALVQFYTTYRGKLLSSRGVAYSGPCECLQHIPAEHINRICAFLGHNPVIDMSKVKKRQRDDSESGDETTTPAAPKAKRIKKNESNQQPTATE